MKNMGYNTSILLAKDLNLAQIADIIPDVFEITDRPISFEHASSSRLAPNFALGMANPWSILWDTYGKLTLDEGFLQQFASVAAIACDLRSTDDRYQLLYAEAGQIQRAVAYTTGKKNAEQGLPLAQEPQPLNEDGVWNIIEQITGWSLSALASQSYQLIALD